MSGRKDVMSWLLVVLGLLLVVSTAFLVIKPQLQPRATVRIGDGLFKARVAQTDDERARGLADVKHLDVDEGMLFVYPSEAKWPIWMKDVEYPIDVVWLNKNKEVVFIVKNVPPDSYPGEFIPSGLAKYVLELPAGAVEKRSIVIKTTAEFDETELERWP